MKLLVCGGRDYADKEYLFDFLDRLQKRKSFTTLVHGAARGADRLAGMWAKSRGLEVVEVPAAWDMYGKSAGYIRNSEMIKHEPDTVVAFPGGKGTDNMIRLALKNGVTVILA